MICMWISIVIGFVNDFVTENKRFGKVGACMWANRRRGRACEIFFILQKYHLSRVVSCRDKWTKGIYPGCSIPVEKPG